MGLFGKGLSPLITLYGFFNPLPNYKILDCFKLKVFADDKMIATEQLKFVLVRVEKEKNLVIFSFSQNVLKRLLLHGC